MPTQKGRSPRVRRNLDFRHRFGGHDGSISARAEEPRSPADTTSRSRVDLRACGGTGRPLEVPLRQGSISARAEEPEGL